MSYKNVGIGVLILVAVVLAVVLFIRGDGDKIGISSTLYCYECISNHPGCDEFNWWLTWSRPCPEADDTCIKLTERKGGTEIITRGCLSSLRAQRHDVPADHYEGCRKSPNYTHLANYVFNNIQELDIDRKHYDDTEWCFCRLDNLCNSGIINKASILVAFAVVIPFMIRT